MNANLVVSRQAEPGRALTVLGAVLLLIVGLSLVIGQLSARGEAALARSNEAFDQGDLEAATEYARQAATWYLPGARYVSSAQERLVAIALGNEAIGERQRALATWSVLRGVLHDTNVPWMERSDRMSWVNAQIVRLLAEQLPPAHADERQALVQAYATTRSTNALFALCTGVGALLMLLAGYFHFATNVRLKLGWSRALVFGAGLFLWLVAAAGA